MLLHINGCEVVAENGETILQTARRAGIFIPTLCSGDGAPCAHSCGICVVENVGESRLPRACCTPAQAGMNLLTHSEVVENARKNLLKLTLSTHVGECFAPCMRACPAEVNCRKVIDLVSQRKMREAAELLLEAHPLPASVSRICPRMCEENCRRTLIDEAVGIAKLKIAAVDSVDISQENFAVQPSGKSVGIVGGGPGGLTAAYFLRRGGHDVYIYEAMEKMGGLLQYGIPEFRLPRTVVDTEIENIRAMGVNFMNKTRMGVDFSLEELRTKHDCVIVAIGAGESMPLRTKGDDAGGVIGGIDFLRGAAALPQLGGKRVVVIGGSNTAMDAARVAARAGADVTVAYRRTRDEMPAHDAEFDDAVADGVAFKFLLAPENISQENGRVCEIKFQVNVLGEPDESGRRAPVPATDAHGGNITEEMPCDMVIAAIGQRVDTSAAAPLQSLQVGDDFATELDMVYAIGDATWRSSFAVEAIAHGRAVAATIHERLGGVQAIITARPKNFSTQEFAREDFERKPRLPRQDDPRKESGRCLECGCDAADKCELLGLMNMYDVSHDEKTTPWQEKPAPHFIPHLRLDTGKCILCGRCVAVCEKEHGMLVRVGRGFETRVGIADGVNTRECMACRACFGVCPTGAIGVS
jgi:formate dehydrogenase major subunit